MCVWYYCIMMCRPLLRVQCNILLCVVNFCNYLAVHAAHNQLRMVFNDIHDVLCVYTAVELCCKVNGSIMHSVDIDVYRYNNSRIYAAANKSSLRARFYNKNIIIYIARIRSCRNNNIILRCGVTSAWSVVYIYYNIH